MKILTISFNDELVRIEILTNVSKSEPVLNVYELKDKK